VADVLNAKLGLNTKNNVRLVKGSHIVVPQLFEGDHSFILQNRDKRIIFAIPYQGRFTLVGTTDVPVDSGPGKAVISDEEVRYLCDAINHVFKREIEPSDVVWTYSGVRPLFDDGSANASAVTRDYVFDMDAPQGRAPVLSIFGGKITTFRKLSEHALDELKSYFPAMKPAWTETAKIPGGDMPMATSTASSPPCASAGPSCPRPWRTACPGPTARGSRNCSAPPRPWPTWARISAPGSPPRRWIT
jgi:glycerol-3-phosphate dehydrogenase